MLILLGLYGLAAAFAVYKFARQGVVWAVPTRIVKSATAQGKQVAISWNASVASAVPRPAKVAVSCPPKVPLCPPKIAVPGPPKAVGMHQFVPVFAPGIRPGPWYAALTGAGPQGYVPVLLAAFLFLAFGLWLVPRTIGARGALIGRLTSRVQRLSETRTDAVDTAAAELRRVERDLHDGAQARLVALGMSLRAAERLFVTSPGAALGMIRD